MKVKKKNKRITTILLPLPNVTGKIHLGHYLNLIIQDFLFKKEELQKKKVLWTLGLDHAGIATYKKFLKNQHQFSTIKKFAKFNIDTILKQLRELKLSLNLQKKETVFTLQHKYVLFLNEQFNQLWKKQLISRLLYPLNWCNNCKTFLSNEEKINSTIKSSLYYIKYRFYYNKTQFNLFNIATKKIETLPSDIAIGISKKDQKKFKKYLFAYNPIIKRKLTLCFLTEKEIFNFGSKLFKISPNHSKKDFELAKKYRLNINENQFTYNPQQKLNSNLHKKFKSRNKRELKEELLVLLKKKKVLTKIEENFSNVERCYRCSTVLENFLSFQWFLIINKKTKIQLLLAIKRIKIFPNFLLKEFQNWIQKMTHWCISRQIKWGSKIPLLQCLKCKNFFIKEEKKCSCNSKLQPIKHRFDTWFSSSLYHLFFLKRKFLKQHIDYLVTGKDILFFWVLRMLLMSELLSKQKFSFKTIIFHGLIRDKNRQKFSKSLNNSPDLSTLIKKYTKSAIRLTILKKIKPGMDYIFKEKEILLSQKLITRIKNLNILKKKILLKNNNLLTSLLANFIINFFTKLTLKLYLNDVVIFEEQFNFQYTIKKISIIINKLLCNIFFNYLKGVDSFNKKKLNKLFSLINNFLYPYLPSLINKTQLKKVLYNRKIPQFNLKEKNFTIIMCFLEELRRIFSPELLQEIKYTLRILFQNKTKREQLFYQLSKDPFFLNFITFYTGLKKILFKKKSNSKKEKIIQILPFHSNNLKILYNKVSPIIFYNLKIIVKKKEKLFCQCFKELFIKELLIKEKKNIKCSFEQNKRRKKEIKFLKNEQKKL